MKKEFTLKNVKGKIDTCYAPKAAMGSVFAFCVIGVSGFWVAGVMCYIEKPSRSNGTAL